MPFVVVRISVRALAPSANSRGEAPDVEAVDDDGVPLAAHDRLVAERGAERSRLVDLGAAEHALVARRERLGDRRGGADHIDDDADGRRSLLVRRESDMNAHADTLVAFCPQPAAPGTATAIPIARPGSRARSASAPSATSA